MNCSLLLAAAVALGGDPITVSGTGCSGCGAPAVYYGGYSTVYAAPPLAMSSCDPCGGRVGLLARLKARFSGGWNRCAPACPAPVTACTVPAVSCAPAPAPVSCGFSFPSCSAPLVSRPLFTGFTTSCSDPCERVGLLARLRAKFRASQPCDAVAAPLAGCYWGSSVASFAPVIGYPSPGCTTSYGTVLTPPAAGGVIIPATPNPMPTPLGEPRKDEPKKDEPKKDEPKKDEPAKDDKKEASLKLPSLGTPEVDIPRVPTLGGTTGKY